MRAAVVIRLIRHRPLTLEVLPEVKMLSDAELAPISDKAQVVDGDKNKLQPSGKFMVTTETFNPYHLLVDM